MTEKSFFERHAGLIITLILIFGLIFSDFFLANIYKWLNGYSFYSKITNPANISEKEYRIASNLYHHDLKKNVNTRAVWGPETYPMITNSLGFRDYQNREIPKESDKYRIVFLGDSFVEGSGVTYQNSFVGMLASKYEDRYDILNAGVVSYAPSAYYRKTRYYLEEYGLKFDEMVLLIDISDISDEVERYADYHASDADLPKLPLIAPEQASADQTVKEFFRHNSILYAIPRYFKIKKANAAASNDPAKNPVLNYRRSLWTIEKEYYQQYGEAGLKKAKANVLNLKKLLDKYRIKMNLVVYPWPAQLYYNDLNSLQVTEWRDFCLEHGINFINLFPEFIGGDPEVNKQNILDYFIRNDMHWNRQGNQKVAAALEEKLSIFRQKLEPQNEQGE